MSNDQKNSGNHLVNGVEKKFGIVVLTVVFVLLFLVGAFLLWDRSRVLEERRQLAAETSQLESIIASMQDGLSSSIDEVDFSQYQTIALENGDLYVGKVIEQDQESMTVGSPLKLNQTGLPSQARSVRMNRSDISYLKNLPANSALLKMLKGTGQR